MIDLQVESDIARILLHHPPYNIIDFELMAKLSQALDAAARARVLILSSALPHFSMGVDVKIHTPELAPEMLEKFHGVIRKLFHFPGISICLLNGYALGGGLEMALVTDFIFAEREANLGFPEIRLACFPPVAAVLLPRWIGRRANRLLFTGETVSAEQARDIGLLDGLFDPSKRDSFQAEIVKKFSSLSADALRALKKLLRKTVGFDFDSELQKAKEIYVTDLLSSPDAIEGVQAFLQKRPPRYGN